MLRALLLGKVKRFYLALMAATVVGIFLTWAVPSLASALPVATTKPATEVGRESADLHGLVNPKGWPTTYWFEYGTSEKYGSKTTEASAGSGFTNVEEGSLIKSLSPGTTYHFRIVATNIEGTSKGADEVFTTLANANTESATNIYAREATLDGSIYPEGLKTTYWFEYGPTTEYGSKTSSQVTAGTELVKVSAALKSLSLGTTYHYRIAMSNANGTKTGGDKTFTTLSHGWFLQSTPNPSGATSSHLKSISCVSGSECVVGGDSGSNPLAELWNGTEWSLMSMPKAGTSINEIDSVSCTSMAACTAVGLYWTSTTTYTTLIERWDGSNWTIQEAPAPPGAKVSVFHGVSCTSATSCIAVGDYQTSEGNWLALAEVWNGSEWKLQEIPNPSGHTTNYLYGISCTSGSACTAVGYSSGTLAERWNGSEWKVQTTPAAGSAFNDVSCASSTSCMAVGTTTSSSESYAANWNGTEWKTVAPLNPSGSLRAEMRGVSCVPAGTTCSAVGWYEPESGVSYPLAEGWNGSNWEIQSAPRPDTSATASDLWGTACLTTNLCEAVGAYNAGGPIYTFAERYE